MLQKISLICQNKFVYRSIKPVGLLGIPSCTVLFVTGMVLVRSRQLVETPQRASGFDTLLLRSWPSASFLCGDGRWRCREKVALALHPDESKIFFFFPFQTSIFWGKQNTVSSWAWVWRTPLSIDCCHDGSFLGLHCESWERKQGAWLYTGSMSILFHSPPDVATIQREAALFLSLFLFLFIFIFWSTVDDNRLTMEATRGPK